MRSLVRFVVSRLRAGRAGPAPEWSSVERILGAALELPREAREAYIDRECAGDARLRREVMTLAAASDADGPIDRPLEAMLSPILAAGDRATTEVAGSETILHYQLLERIPGGGMGVIYRAHDTRLKRIVALKCLPALGTDDRAKSRFLLEARAAAALDHRNVCAIHEIGEARDDQLFIAMPYYEGETIADRIARGPLSIVDAIGIAAQVAAGLAHAHERGLIHRDVKPANVMLTREGVAKILDFGIVKFPGVGFTRTGALIGTLPYMSPEQLRRSDVDARSDIWSLGVVLYEMLAGRRPFDDPDDHAIREAITFAQPPSLRALRPDIPEDVSRLVTGALAKHPDDRPDSAARFAAALDAMHGSLPPAESGGVERALAGEPSASGPALCGDTAAVLPGGERRPTTVVVSRLSGYGELVERCLPDEVDAVMRHLKQHTWEIAERHGGVINEFSEERTVLLFGVPVSHEDHCLRATRAALDQRAMLLEWRATRPSVRSLALHTAIDTGESAVQRLESSIVRYRVAGRPVRRAAQLCDHARNDEILLSPDAHRVVGTQFTLTPGTPLTLGDGEEPVAATAVDRECVHQDRLDQMERRSDLTRFTGRDAELALLVGAFHDSRAGRGELVTVSGEAGLGKSRLLLEFRRTLDPAAVIALVGRCSSYGQDTPYLPFVHAMRQLLKLEGPGVHAWTDDEVAARIDEWDVELKPFLPYYLQLLSVAHDNQRVTTRANDERARVVMQEALVALFVAAAGQRPVALLLEDWHWVDAASRQTLKRLVGVLREHRLLVVLTTRTAQRIEEPQGDSLRVVMLRPLAASASAEMLHGLLAATEVPADLVSRVLERTGGNPFFLEEIARSLIEAGTIRVEGGRATVAGSVDALQMPATVQAVIRARLDRLDLEVRHVLRAAAVVGREFSRDILVRVVRDPGRLDDALEALGAAGIVRRTALLPGPAYAFGHALSHEAAYGGLLERQRAELHARVGAALEEMYAGQLDDRLDRLAQHFSLAENWPKAVHYGLRSAERIRALHHLAEALALLDRTREWATQLEEDERHATIVEILFRQERLCDAMGQRERQRLITADLLTLLERGRDGGRLAEAYLRLGELHTILNEFDRAEEPLQHSLRLRREAGDALGERASLRGLGFLRRSQRRYEDALECNEAALTIDRRHGRVNAIVGDLQNLASIHIVLGRLAEARGCLEEALELSEPARNGADRTLRDLWESRVAVLYSYGCLLARCGELDRALDYLGPDGEWRHARENPLRVGHFFTAAAHVHVKKGLIAECLEDYRRAIDATRRGQLAPELAQALQLYGEMLVTLGRDREALAAFDEAARVCVNLDDRAKEAAAWSHIARVHERLGTAAESQSAWERALAAWKSAGDCKGEIEALEGLGRVARRHLPSSVALRFYEEAIVRAGESGDSTRTARLHNSAGIIEWTRARYERALEHFHRALEMFEAVGDVAGAGQMMNSIAVSLSALGQWEQAREQLRNALAHHERTGQAQLEAHALAALGDAHWDAGETTDAVPWYERSLVRRRAIADRRGEGWMLQRLARAEASAGAREAADRLLARATELSDQCGDEELMDACHQLRRALADSSAGGLAPP